MRTVRWQFLALMMAAALFIASLFLRLSQPPAPAPTSTAAPVGTAFADATATSQTVNVALQATEAPTQPAANLPPVYREALVGQLSRLNPVFADLNPVDADVSSLIFEGLTATNAYGEPTARLAERWTISSDGLDYIVYLRQNVLWQDGVPFTSADVEYTMAILRAADFPGSSELNAFWRTVETQALGDYIVRFRLTQPLGIFLDRLRIGILPEHALRGTSAAQLATHPFNLSPIGTGAYQLEELRGDGVVQQVDLLPAPVYRERTSDAYALDRISFLLFNSFEEAQAALDAQTVDALAARTRSERQPLFLTANQRNLDTNNQLENTLGVLIFNWQNTNTPFFRDQRVRVALQAGLDGASVIERALGNRALPADSPLMLGSWAYQADLPWASYDPAYAQSLLVTAAERLEATTDQATPIPPSDNISPGAPPTPTFAPTPVSTLFAFAILTPDDPDLISLAQEIATQWSQLNLNVTVDAVPLDVYRQRLDNSEFDTAIVELSLGESADPDVYNFWDQGQYPDGDNYGGVDDRRLAVLLERARQDWYGVNRVRDYTAFQQLFAERAIALPLYYPLYTFVTAPRVQGVQLGFIGSPADRFRNIGQWSLLP